MTTTKLRIGLDFGGVIVRHIARIPGEDTRIWAARGEQVAHSGMFEQVRRLVAVAQGSVWIVSKASPAMQARTLEWMGSVDFHMRTGLAPSNVRFCRERADKQVICSELCITHFVDDLVHVMQILRGTVQSLYLFGSHHAESQCPPWATRATDWKSLADLIVGEVGGRD
jgi:hypothetical protein